MRLNRLGYLPLIVFCTAYFLTCYIGAVILVWGPSFARDLYKIYSGVDIPVFSDGEVWFLIGLLHLPVLLLCIGYVFGIKTTGVLIRHTIRVPDALDYKSALVLWGISFLFGMFAVWRGGALSNAGAWAASYDYWISARWELFKILSLPEFINLYVILPVTTSMAILLLWQEKKIALALAVLLLGLIVTLLLFQKKQPMVFMLMVAFPFWVKKLKASNGDGQLSRRMLKTFFTIFVVYFILFFAPTFGLSDAKENTVQRGDFIAGVSSGGGAQEQVYANFPDLIKKSLFAINSIVFRTSAPAVFYPVTFPGKANFYGLDLPFDHFTPDDNLLVWKVMWPKTPGGSVSAAFQFSLYAQVGLLGAIILAFFTGVLLGGSWACVLKMDGSGPISLLLATLLLIFSIFLAIDSIRNSVVSSYGLIWAGLYLMLIMAASYARIRRNNTLGL